LGAAVTTIVRLVLGAAALAGIGTPGHSQDLQTDGILWDPDGKVAAALAFAPGDRAVVAYVVRGTGEDHGSKKKVNWSEVRLTDVSTGRHRVLHRTATPVELPGVAADHALRGFTADGRKVAVTTTDPGGTTTDLLLNVIEPEPKDKEKK
jgi:hypothetical protein